MMSPLRYTLPFRVLITSFLLLVIPLVIFVILEIRRGYLDQLVQAQNNLINITQQRAGNLAEVTSSKMLILEQIGHFLDIPKLLPDLPNEKANQLFKELVQTGGIWGLEIYKITPVGRFINVCSDQPHFLGEDLTVLYVNIIDIHRKKKATILRNSSRVPYEELFLTTMSIDEKGRPVANFTMAFDMSQFLKTLLTPLFMPNEINFALLTEFDVVFAASDRDLRFQLFRPLSPQLRSYFEQSNLYNGYKLSQQPLDLIPLPDSTFFEFSFKGQRQLAYRVTVPHTQIKVLSYVAKEAITGQILHKFIPIFALFCLIFLLGGFIVYILTLLMAKPFHQLAACMEEAKNNNYNIRYKPNRFGFEINYLGEIFNEMLLSTREYIKRAEEERAKREAIVQELKIGHNVQRQILPQSIPTYPKIELAECYIPAKEVSGDFYDAFIQEIDGREKLFFAIADVSGKGISACLYSLGVSSLIRGFGKEIPDLPTLMNLVNKNFIAASGASGMFVTVLVGTYDQLTEEVSYISCGHNPALIKRKNGEVELLKDQGIALGFLEHIDFQENKISFQEGDILVLYTDGIVDATNEKGEFFTMERLLAFWKKQNPTQTAHELVQSLINAIETFTSSSVQHDDITLLIIKKTSGAD